MPTRNSQLRLCVGFARVYGMVPQAEKTMLEVFSRALGGLGPGLAAVAVARRAVASQRSVELDLVNLLKQSPLAETQAPRLSLPRGRSPRSAPPTGSASASRSSSRCRSTPRPAPRWRPPRCRAQVSGRWRGAPTSGVGVWARGPASGSAVPGGTSGGWREPARRQRVGYARSGRPRVGSGALSPRLFRRSAIIQL